MREGTPQSRRGESSSQGANREVPPFLAKRRHAWGRGRMIETYASGAEKAKQNEGLGQSPWHPKGALGFLSV